MNDLESRISKLEKSLSAFSGELRLALHYVQPDAASSLTKSRAVLEKLLVEVYIAEMGRSPRKPLLGEILADNQFTKRIERRILSRMNAIRDLGNLGPHGEPVQPSDAIRVLDDLCEVLDWYLRSYSNADPSVDQGVSEDPGKEGPAAQNQIHREDPQLRRLHRAVLVAASSLELRRTLYELEAYLAQHPHSVEGRLLKDSVQTAIQRMEATDRPKAWKGSALRASRRFCLSIGCLILAAASLFGLLYLIWRLIFPRFL
jgi:hypothetical protein